MNHTKASARAARLLLPAAACLLAAGLTALLLFYHDKNGPRYIHIYGDEF